jgi:nucleotide-binding universal stress UspA family protein
MTQKTLLLAIDQFESGQAAVDFTIGFAGERGGDVMVFHVRELSRSPKVPPIETVTEAESLVDDAVRTIQLAGIGAFGLIRAGRDSDVGSLIVEEASTFKCSAIVLGSLRLKGAQRIAGRGVRESVLQHTSLPVCITPTALRFGRLTPRSASH